MHGKRAFALHIFTFIVAALFSGDAHAQDRSPAAETGQAHMRPAEAATRRPEVERLNRGADELRKSGKYEEALSLAREALAITLDKDGRDSLAAARALTRVADIYFEVHNYAEAEPLYRRALEIDEAAGADPAEIAVARENLTKISELQQPRQTASRVSDKKLSDHDAEIQSTAPGEKMHAATRAFHAEQVAPKGDKDSKIEIRQNSAQKRSGASSDAQPAPTEWDVVPIYYGTDREHQPNPKRVEYSDERAHRLELGRALVTVPKNHQVPNIERPWSLHIPYFDVTLQGTEDPKEHFTLQEIKSLSKSGFLALVRERLAASTRFKDHAFVFVHGYNTSFDNALYRTAQIANDLHFDGAPFVYSWPSGGAVATYGWDRESAEGARPYLREFLDIVVKETGAKSISVIAHSMGNIALLDVLRDMNKAKPPGVAISQIILAAPDVSIDDFAELAKSIQGLSKGVTLYASSNDRALQISRGIWRSYRAGDVPPSGPILAAGVDTIDVTKASTEVFALNHSGYAENNDLLNDVGALVDKGLHPPEIRSAKLHPVVSAKGGYWQYLP